MSPDKNVYISLNHNLSLFFQFTHQINSLMKRNENNRRKKKPKKIFVFFFSDAKNLELNSKSLLVFRLSQKEN